MAFPLTAAPLDSRFKSGGTVFILLAIFFLFSRLLILLTNVEGVSNLEELYRGALAQEFRDVLKFPFFDYQADSYSGGSLVIGFFASYFFQLLGPSLFALKLTALLCFSWPSWILSVFFMNRYFGRQEALLAGFLYLLAPPTLIANSLFGMGYHSDSILFSVLIFMACYEYQFKGKKILWLFCAGLLAGAGTWFINTTFVSLAACALGLGFQKKNFWSPHAWGIIALGFLIGGLPWIAFNLSHSPGGFDFIKDLYGASASTRPSMFRFILSSLKRLLLLEIYWIPLSFGYLNILKIPGMLLGYLHFILAAYLLIDSFEKKRIGPACKPILFYLGLFFLAYITAHGLPLPNYKAYSEFRYFAPPLWILALCSAAWLPSHPKARVLTASFLALGILGYVSLIGSEWGKALQYKGYSYFRFGDARDDLWRLLPRSWERQLEFFQKFPQPHRRNFFWGLAQNYPFHGESFNLLEVEEMLKTIPSPERGYWLSGLGFYLGNHKRMDAFLTLHEALPETDRKYLAAAGYSMALPNMVDAFPEYLENSRRVPENIRRYFFFAAGQMDYRPDDPLWFFSTRKLMEVPEDCRLWVYRGIGAAFSGYWIWDPAHFVEEYRKLLVRIPQDYRVDFHWGIGWGIRREISEDKLRAHDWILRFPESSRNQAKAGMTSFEEYFGILE